MPIPLKPGYAFKAEHKIRDGNYSMGSTDVYRDFYSVGLFIRGNRLLLSPGKTHRLTGLRMTFIHKNLYHRAVSASEDPYETYTLRFTDAAIKPLIRAIGQEAFDGLFEEIVIKLTEEGIQEVSKIFQSIFDEWAIYDKKPSRISELILEGFLNLLFITALRNKVHHYDTDHEVKDTYPPLIDALKYIEKHFSKNPSLRDTARAVGVSSSHLSKMFTSKLNTNYSTFLNEEKINHAQKLLVNSGLSMVEVAQACGYTNSNYFSDVFKKILGISPLKFRKGMNGQAGLDLIYDRYNLKED